MTLNQTIEDQLKRFIGQSSFASSGGLITDLDGTAVHEVQGKVFIPKTVELGLKLHYDMGRQLVLNSLRFPLSVMRTFGRDWHRISNSPIPIVSLNGSQLGWIDKTDEGELTFEEINAFPLTKDDIDEALQGIDSLIQGGIKDLLVFYYPRDWRVGEVIWTPQPEQIIPVKEKYVSASAVTAVEFSKLREQLLAEDICMIFLLINVAADQLMAYQHSKPSNFITRKGVDKLFGTREIARILNFDLNNSLGAGDTRMDNFLPGVGLAVVVGNLELEYHGLFDTIRVNDSAEFGDLLFRAAELLKEKTV